MHIRGYSGGVILILASIESLAPTLSYFAAFLTLKRSVNYTYLRHVRKL